MPELPKFDSPEAEMRHIEGTIIEEREAESRRGERLRPKEHIGNVVRAHIQQVSQGLSANDEDSLADLDLDEHREDVEALIQLAFEKGITTAVKAAKASKSPHLIDEFHDTLTDHLYERMIAAGVISRDN